MDELFTCIENFIDFFIFIKLYKLITTFERKSSVQSSFIVPYRYDSNQYRVSYVLHET